MFKNKLNLEGINKLNNKNLQTIKGGGFLGDGYANSHGFNQGVKLDGTEEVDDSELEVL